MTVNTTFSDPKLNFKPLSRFENNFLKVENKTYELTRRGQRNTSSKLSFCRFKGVVVEFRTFACNFSNVRKLMIIDFWPFLGFFSLISGNQVSKSAN